jgi:predicted nucleic acid-binding protein
MDDFIAATAILDQAEVATVNETDFKVFVRHELNLAVAPGSSLRIPTA